MIQIAVMGYGTVGSGVVEVLNTNQASIDKRVGEEVRVKYVLDLRDFPGDPVESVLVHDFETIVNDPEVKVVVEVMGGVEPAYTFTKRCLLAGKSVCTSNKALVAAHGAELLQIAKDKNLNYLFEASVGGGIPIIRPLQTCLTADEIVEISGILNGTMDAFASIISNNMNIVMKVLAIITIVMSIPTIVFSAYGMNVAGSGMPLSRSPLGFLIIILISVAISVVAAIILSKKRFF